jgi:hypothetical protein
MLLLILIVFDVKNLFLHFHFWIDNIYLRLRYSSKMPTVSSSKVSNHTVVGKKTFVFTNVVCSIHQGGSDWELVGEKNLPKAQ